MFSLKSLALLTLSTSLLYACGSSDSKNSYSLTVNSTGSDMTLDSATARIELYGYDAYTADNAATLIAGDDIAISALPAQLTIKWPEEAHKLIKDPAVSDPENARFYVVVQIDKDSDGQICHDDYVQDGITSVNLNSTDGITATVTPKVSYSCTAIGDSNVDLMPFIEKANATECGELANVLYTINGNLVFWHRGGNCPDNGYYSALFEGSLDKVLAEQYDSIAGPQTKINNESYKSAFETIVDNLDKENLGLDNSFTVRKIIFKAEEQ